MIHLGPPFRLSDLSRSPRRHHNRSIPSRRCNVLPLQIQNQISSSSTVRPPARPRPLLCSPLRVVVMPGPDPISPARQLQLVPHIDSLAVIVFEGLDHSKVVPNRCCLLLSRPILTLPPITRLPNNHDSSFPVSCCVVANDRILRGLRIGSSSTSFIPTFHQVSAPVYLLCSAALCLDSVVRYGRWC